MRLVHPPLIELRQYIIAPGRRDRMVELFDTHFVDAQDALDLPILGHFTVANDPDRLVWLRGFADMPTRPDRLGAFYGGPVWAAFGAEAIALVKAYDNVQLLREAAPSSGIAVDLARRPPPGATVPGHNTIVATTYRVHHLEAPAVAAIVATLPPGQVIGAYISDPTPNNFPALPIRQGEHLFTWFATCGMAEAEAVAANEQLIAPFLAAAPERLVLHPAPRSVLR